MVVGYVIAGLVLLAILVAAYRALGRPSAPVSDPHALLRAVADTAESATAATQEPAAGARSEQRRLEGCAQALDRLTPGDLDASGATAAVGYLDDGHTDDGVEPHIALRRQRRIAPSARRADNLGHAVPRAGARAPRRLRRRERRSRCALGLRRARWRAPSRARRRHAARPRTSAAAHPAWPRHGVPRRPPR